MTLPEVKKPQIFECDAVPIEAPRKRATSGVALRPWVVIALLALVVFHTLGLFMLAIAGLRRLSKFV